MTTTDLLTLDDRAATGPPEDVTDRCPQCGARPDESCPDAVSAGVDAVPGCPRTGLPPAVASAEDPEDADAASASELSALVGCLSQPENTGGVYMVLWAKVPDQGVAPEHCHRPDWQEVGYFTASSRDVARAQSIEHHGRSPKPIAERGAVARYLIEQARATAAGIMLRAVPAEYWPASCPVTSYTVPAPILTLDS